MATQTFIPGTNIPVNAPVPVNPQQPPMAAKDGHVMSDDEIRAYKEKWEQDKIETDKLIENAVKLLQFEPAGLTGFTEEASSPQAARSATAPIRAKCLPM